jgi:hypothetical protein
MLYIQYGTVATKNYYNTGKCRSQLFSAIRRTSIGEKEAPDNTFTSCGQHYFDQRRYFKALETL